MRKRRWKTGNYKLFIIVGFLTLYLVGMFLITFLTKEQSLALARTSASHITGDMTAEIEDIQLIYEDGVLSDYCLDYMQYILSSGVENMDQYTMVSYGLLDADGNLIAQTAECYYQFQPSYINGEPRFWLIDFGDYFSEEDMALFRQCYYVEKQKKYNSLERGYAAQLSYDEENNKLIHLYINETRGKENEDGIIETIRYDEVFRYINTDYAGKQLEYASYVMPIDNNMLIPYLEYGEEIYEKWKKDPHLHNYFQGFMADDIANAYADRSFEKYESTYVNRIYLGDNSEKDYGNPDYILITNYKAYPWQEAVSQLSSTYIYSACFVAVCMVLVLYLTGKTYKKQAQLEQTRRDFTNAIAHELKTPLSIVRGLAETMEESVSEEKKSFYRKEIVNQTEVMDDLVKNMIFISRMDSEQMVLKKEPVSILSILEEQTNHLIPLIQERNLQIEYRKDEDFIIEGDRSCLEKAVFNLIENAISHNRQDGRICIHVRKNACIIENTANPIPEEDLPHVFDILHTTNKSRTNGDYHKGLGLYLTKRILDLQGISIRIENTDIGVAVTINI